MVACGVQIVRAGNSGAMGYQVSFHNAIFLQDCSGLFGERILSIVSLCWEPSCPLNTKPNYLLASLYKFPQVGCLNVDLKIL